MPSSYQITDAFGNPVQVQPGQTAQQALSGYYSAMGMDPSLASSNQTNLTPQWNPLYTSPLSGGVSTVNNPDTGQPMSASQYQQMLPQFQQERAAGAPTISGTPTAGMATGDSIAQPTTGGGGAPSGSPYQFSTPVSSYALNGSPSQAGYTAPGGAFSTPQPYQGQTSPFSFPQGYQSGYNFSSGVNGGPGTIQTTTTPSIFNAGAGGQTMGGLVNGLMDQGQLEAQFGQQGMSAMLQNMQNFGGGIQSQLANALGLSNQMTGQMPSSLNFSGQAETGALNTQNALVQQLLGQTMSPLQGIVNQFQTNQGPLGSGPGLTTNAQNMLNAIGGQLSSPITQSLGLMGQGLNPATSAALQTQAMDQTAQQYNNAKQSTMTQLMNQGVMGGGAANPGGGEAQSLNDLGALSTAQQQQQSQLQQQAILANQSQLNQNNQMGLQAIGQTGNIADMFTNLQQQAAEAGNQQILGASGLTGNLASSLGGLYGNESLGYGNLTNSLYNMGMNYPTSYMNTEANTLNSLLGGAQGLGQLGIQGVNSAAPFMNNAIALANPGAGAALANAGLSSIGSILSSLAGTL